MESGNSLEFEMDPIEPSFDFRTYLLKLTGRLWQIQELSGGNANHTVRATRKNVVSDSEQDATQLKCDGLSLLDDHTSIVVKQAPPYFAKDPDMSFSTYRQTIEAKGLSLFYSQSSPTLSQLLVSNPAIRISRLLHHDLSANVLIQTDLGAHPLLDAFLAAPTTSPTLASATGKYLGCFLKELHHAFDTIPEVQKEELRDTFRNEDGEAILCEVIANTKNYMKDAGVNDFEILGERALNNWNKRQKTAFGQGDIWFGTVLVSAQGGKVQLGICDWEFTGFNHPAGDIAQLGSYLHLSSMSPLTTPATQSILQSFASALYSSYFSPSTTSSDGSHYSKEFQRTLIIMHAWELINAAAWRHYLWCACSGQGVKCAHIIEIVRVGAKMLRAAGEEGDVKGVCWDVLGDLEWIKFINIGY